jgi:hypothetical protein
LDHRRILLVATVCPLADSTLATQTEEIAGMQLTENFSLEELVFSCVASRQGIVNTPGPTELANLQKTASLMEAVRTMFGKPVRVHSGFRCPRLNEVEGGSKTSVHPLGLACDFNIPGVTTYQTACAIRDRLASLPSFDQCILEYGWVHLGLPRPATGARVQFLTKRSSTAPYLPGILPGILA